MIRDIEVGRQFNCGNCGGFVKLAELPTFHAIGVEYGPEFNCQRCGSVYMILDSDGKHAHVELSTRQNEHMRGGGGGNGENAAYARIDVADETLADQPAIRAVAEAFAAVEQAKTKAERMVREAMAAAAGPCRDALAGFTVRQVGAGAGVPPATVHRYATKAQRIDPDDIPF